ncbi:expansin family protein [Fomitopsis betulina]|nr:expansin family protein [Fomitopsis betulina]
MLLTDTALIIGLITYASAVGISHADNIEALEKSVAGRDDWPSGTQTGDVNFTEFGLGACGVTNTDSDDVVAISYEIFDNYPGYNGDPPTNPVCFQQLTITYEGKSVTVTVTDRCSTCSLSDLAVTPGAFEQLADLSAGQLDDATWQWV